MYPYRIPNFFWLGTKSQAVSHPQCSPNVHLTCYFSICHRKSTVSGWYVPLNPIYVQWFKLGISMDKSISMNIISSHLFPYPQLLLVKSLFTDNPTQFSVDFPFFRHGFWSADVPVVSRNILVPCPWPSSTMPLRPSAICCTGPLWRTPSRAWRCSGCGRSLALRP